MSRYRIQPTPAQAALLLEYCGHARFVWNLAVEQHGFWNRAGNPHQGSPNSAVS
ncbi:helix-turn-helix domain-containing protein [Herbidospora cretacea]|uniref:helix-turn-helix domain-containing protein n=1 Tax=Herbidospora cretacea TaxID=28444 RepID=UPI001C3F4DB6